MQQISQLIERLQQALSYTECSGPGRKRIVLPLTVARHFSLLHWLADQTVFPQFYWCHRDNSEEMVACGSVIDFADIDAANIFIQQDSELTTRIWGLNAFDQTSIRIQNNQRRSYLFLPRLEICLRPDTGYLAVNLFSHTELQHDLLQARLFLQQLKSAISDDEPITEVLQVTHLPEQLAWNALLAQAITEIEQHRFEKVVMARRTELRLSGRLNPALFLAASKQVNRDCYHFLLQADEQEAFLGSTPERLFYRQNHQLTTEALAGTVASAEEDDEAQKLADWLMNDKKNQHENMLVVDDICQRLQSGVKQIEVQPAKIVRLRKVQHLCRSIRATLNSINDADCLLRLQPTAAVAGLPRKPAFDFIVENEPFSRDWYAGSAGYLSKQQTEFAVSLRSALIKESSVYLYAGAGIVAGSDPVYEWQEIENKAAGLRTLIDSTEL